jgi:hypothetical protein
MTVLAYLLGFLLVSVIASILIGAGLSHAESTPAPPARPAARGMTRSLWIVSGGSAPRSAASVARALRLRRHAVSH